MRDLKWALAGPNNLLVIKVTLKNEGTVGLDELMNQQRFTAVVKQDEGSWIGWIAEVPGVNCQEATREALMATLRITWAEAIEFNRAEALDAAGKGYEELPIAV